VSPILLAAKEVSNVPDDKTETNTEFVTRRPTVAPIDENWDHIDRDSRVPRGGHVDNMSMTRGQQHRVNLVPCLDNSQTRQHAGPQGPASGGGQSEANGRA